MGIPDGWKDGFEYPLDIAKRRERIKRYSVRPTSLGQSTGGEEHIGVLGGTHVRKSIADIDDLLACRLLRQ